MAEADDNQIPFKPYILRAMIDWCEDNGFEPYLLTQVDDETVVPREFVQDGKITLSVASEALTSGMMSSGSTPASVRLRVRSFFR